MVSLLWQDYFGMCFSPWLGPAEGSVADADHMFDLKKCQWRGHTLSRYVELDMEFLGLQVPRVGFLINQNPNEVLYPEHMTNLSRIVGWNVMRLAYHKFINKHNNVFEHFECTDEVTPLLFSQLCI